ncbi:MAG: hypothetical protein KAY22_19345 [Rhizorhabdus sp.]|uniref:hypothetical protein n=1 Tax=Rhizorhabdus sp. TaxID=1968843 RepID=UPI001B5C8646|nr:hypothetical protein [Rhizorhabdus sp.]MBP8234454.1 hypothetical protein [Rhizorhabdus sp.]
MSDLTPGWDADLRGRAPTVFGAVSIELPDYQVNLLDGAGQLSFNSRTFVGKDPTYGTLSAISSLTDGMGNEAPRLSVTLLPASDAAAADLAGPDMQGSLVTIYMGGVDRATGQVIPSPHLLFIGELDVPVLTAGENSRELEYEVASIFERFFTDDEGARLSTGFHKSIWPGELGFDFQTGVPQGVYWGVEAPPRAVSYTMNAPWGFQFSVPESFVV